MFKSYWKTALILVSTRTMVNDAWTQPTQSNCIDLLTNWNISLTDRMLQQMSKSRSEQIKEQLSSLEVRKTDAKNAYQLVCAQLEQCKIELYKNKCELQRLNDEYLLSVELYGPLIETKECERASLTLKYENLRQRVVQARISYKDLLAELRREKKEVVKENKESSGCKEAGLKMDVYDDEDEEEIDNKNVFIFYLFIYLIKIKKKRFRTHETKILKLFQIPSNQQKYI